jgi:hypothetical protein
MNNCICDFNINNIDGLWEIQLNKPIDKENMTSIYIMEIINIINRNKNNDLGLFLTNIEKSIDDYEV